MASTNRRDAVPKEIEVTFRCAPPKISWKKLLAKSWGGGLIDLTEFHRSGVPVCPPSSWFQL